MAKRGRPKGTSKSTEDRIEAFAEDLGRLLGTARAKADNWLNQRQQIAKTLTDIRDTASRLLTQLGGQAKTIRRKGKLGWNASAPIGRKKRRRMSAKARAAISAAQKARWAKVKANRK